MIQQLIRLTFAATVLLSLIMTSQAEDPTHTKEKKIKALIIDGQNNHQAWPKSTVMMKQYLEETGIFEVDVERTKFTWKAAQEKKFLALAGVEIGEDLNEPKTDPDFAPAFKDYDVVISNFGYKAAAWPQKTQTAFEQYMKTGGGFVTVHAADNSFGDWVEYNKIIGLGGWGGRNAKDGVYVYYDENGNLKRDDSSLHVGSHGPQHNIPISLRTEHPITKGMPDNWLSAKDECYAFLNGPAENMTVLATGKDATKQGKTNRHEPVLMVVEYGQGRVFHTTLGHAAYSCEGVGFITTFVRGCQWAATGEVTLPVPDDFPTHEQSKSRPFKVLASAPND